MISETFTKEMVHLLLDEELNTGVKKMVEDGMAEAFNKVKARLEASEIQRESSESTQLFFIVIR